MIHILGNLPQKECWLACSGGVDSMFAAKFLANQGKRKVNLVFVNHNTETSAKAENFLLDFTNLFPEYSLFRHTIAKEKPHDESWEEFWRKERIKVFCKYPTIITAHHLDDAVETYIWRMLHGRLDIISYKCGNIIRPFLLNEKQKLIDFATRHDVPYIQDESNNDVSFTRNRIRHCVLPEIKKLDGNIYKTVAKLVKKY